MLRVLSVLLIILMTGIISSVNAADLTVEQLKNNQYFIPAWENPDQGEWVQLRSGGFTRRSPDNPLFVSVVEIAFGYLANHQTKDAAVIYGYNTGGSGFFVMLSAVINDRGKPKFIAFADLEDRVKINSLSIQSGKIIVDLMTHGPNDPACCPTVRKVATYTLVGDKLVEK